MKVASANIQDNPDHPIHVVLAYLKRVALFFGFVDFVAFQEISDASDKEAIRRHFPADKYHHLHFDTPTPFVLRKKKWVIEDEGKDDGIDGRKGFTPNRDFCWCVAYKRRSRKPVAKRRRFCFGGYHQINGAWNGRFPETERERQNLWILLHKVVELRAEWARERDMHFIFAADQNRIDVPKFRKSQRCVASHGIDQVHAIPAKGHTVVKIRRGSMKNYTPMDHPPIFGVFAFRRRLRK